MLSCGFAGGREGASDPGLYFDPDLIRDDATFAATLRRAEPLVHIPQAGAVAILALLMGVEVPRHGQRRMLGALLREDLAGTFNGDASPSVQNGAPAVPADYRMRSRSGPTE